MVGKDTKRREMRRDFLIVGNFLFSRRISRLLVFFPTNFPTFSSRLPTFSVHPKKYETLITWTNSLLDARIHNDRIHDARIHFDFRIYFSRVLCNNENGFFIFVLLIYSQLQN